MKSNRDKYVREIISKKRDESRDKVNHRRNASKDRSSERLEHQKNWFDKF